jgi:hypothetical protein
MHSLQGRPGTILLLRRQRPPDLAALQEGPPGAAISVRRTQITPRRRHAITI